MQRLTLAMHSQCGAAHLLELSRPAGLVCLLGLELVLGGVQALAQLGCLLQRLLRARMPAGGRGERRV